VTLEKFNKLIVNPQNTSELKWALKSCTEFLTAALNFDQQTANISNNSAV